MPSLRLKPLKLHTKTTVLISAVLVAVFALIAYFYDRYTTNISKNRDEQQARLLAIQVADLVEHHIKRERIKGHEHSAEEEALEPDWTEVQSAITDTIMKDRPVRDEESDRWNSNQQIAEVRIFDKVAGGAWQEKVRLPQDAGPPLFRPPFRRDGSGATQIIATGEQGSTRLISAVCPVISSLENGAAREIGSVSVLLAFDETQSTAARLRRLIWPLMLLAILGITLVTYLLFRHIIYNPIDKLLFAMSKAEAGDLATEVEPFAPDEIGLLTSRFNRMLGRIRVMTDQLGLQQRRLEDRVREATAEIADRKEQLEVANLQLFEMQRQLTQLERMAAAGQLAAQFAHEVGTPLNLISGHVQLLRARTTDDRVIKRLDVIAGQIDRITTIVRSMLDSTRRPEPQFEAVDIGSLLVRIFDATQPTLAARGVELQTDMADGLPSIKADPDQLQQVFINLINNSLDAMPLGGTLLVSTYLAENLVVIELSDTGEGIAKDEIDLIFDPLFTTKHGRGTGLGLTIVKQIISEHGGSVEVESEPGRRTVFRIRLPGSLDQEAEEAEKAPGAPAFAGSDSRTSAALFNPDSTLEG